MRCRNGKLGIIVTNETVCFRGIYNLVECSYEIVQVDFLTQIPKLSEKGHFGNDLIGRKTTNTDLGKHKKTYYPF
jgi:hypothetical protein